MSYAIEVEGLTKTYSGDVKALKGVNLKVERGDFFALLGPNGAGKSTMLNVISTLVKPTSGSVRVCGHDLREQEFQAKLSLGITPQEFNMSIFETCLNSLVSQAGFYGIGSAEAKKRALRNLEFLGLSDKKDTIAKNLSGGMKRRLMIARAMMHDPQVLILDEPTAGVDIEVRKRMWELISRLNNEGLTIVLTTHYLEEAEQLCRNIAIIDKGEILLNSTVKDVVAAQSAKSFIIDVEPFSGELANIPEGITINRRSEDTLEATAGSNTDLNVLFACLASNSVKTLNLRNRTNRLEELFVRLTGNAPNETPAKASA